METIAVYWEPRVKTYGFQMEPGLLLHSFETTEPGYVQWAKRWDAVSAPHGRFYLVSTLRTARNAVSVDCVLGAEEMVCSGFDPPVGCDDFQASRTAVDLIGFQGPHFGDRYGIADFTCRSHPGSVPILLALFSGASVYWVVPAGSGNVVRDALSKAFEIPLGPERFAGKKLPGTNRPRS